METKRAGDIMIPLEAYPHLASTATLRDAIREMDQIAIEASGRVSAPRVVLVFNNADQLVGLVRRRDILRGLEPRFMAQRTPTSRESLNIKVEGRNIDMISGYNFLILHF